LVKISAFILVFTISSLSFAQNSSQLKELDSIQILRNLSVDGKYSDTQRLNYAKLATTLSTETGIDSTILKSNVNLSSHYLRMENYDLYRDINHKNLILANELKDSSAVGKTYRNLAWYHYVQSDNDSSYFYYYNARDVFRRLGQVQNEGEVLLNMADIQETEKDYVGSENNAVKAIKLIQSLNESERNLDTLWLLHNLMGVISENLKNYDKAQEYHQKALGISRKMSNGFEYRTFSLNNIAVVHREIKDYSTALNYHEDLLANESLKESSPGAYALYLNNYAFTKFLSNDYSDDEILENFWKSYYICDQLEYDVGVMTVSKSLLDYYLSKSVMDSALYYGNRTYDLAKSSSSNDILLEAMLSLSKIEKGEIGNEYLNDYIKLNDSLVQNERSIRDKFARIEFETDQIKAENEEISRQRLILFLVSIGLIVLFSLLFVIIYQRNKNKKLEFRQMQQQANEEIYNLMLVQQDKVEEGRTVEKKRISEELHDGILGRLFGTRLSLDSLNMVQTAEATKTRGQYIEELKAIEQEIRKISHDLNADFVSGSSFSDIIISLIGTQTEAYKLTYDFQEDGEIDWDNISNKTKIHIYRILQETMQNIYKHAKAKHIKISFQLKNSVILLTVEDDGVGFNTKKARKGIGLKNFDSRAKEFGGKIEIFSKIGQGTKVKVHVPNE
jgi:signal transduction histidine kinase